MLVTAAGGGSVRINGDPPPSKEDTMPTNKGALHLDRRAGEIAADLALQDPDALLTYDEVGIATHDATITIKKMCERGVGPPFRKTGLRNRHVTRGNLVIWLRGRAARFAAEHAHDHIPKTARRAEP